MIPTYTLLSLTPAQKAIFGSRLEVGKTYPRVTKAASDNSRVPYPDGPTGRIPIEPFPNAAVYLPASQLKEVTT